MPKLPVHGLTGFLLFMKTEVDCTELINENTAQDAAEDLGNGLLIICAIKEAARKWQEDTPEDIKIYFEKRAKAINKTSHISPPDKKVENDFIRELGSDTGFFGTILRNRVWWFEENIEKKTMGWQMIELYIYWNQMNKKRRKEYNKYWREHFTK